MEEKREYLKLNSLKFALAGGLVFAFSYALTTIFALFGIPGFPVFAKFLEGIYGWYGYSVSVLGIFAGAINGFIEGFVHFFIFALIYNLLLKKSFFKK
jgi:hypothetical protein